MIVKIPAIIIKNNNHPDILQIDMKVSCFLTGAFFFLFPIINPPKYLIQVVRLHLHKTFSYHINDIPFIHLKRLCMHLGFVILFYKLMIEAYKGYIFPAV